MTFPTALRQAIDSKGITQMRAAELLGTDRANISRWINEGVEPTAEFYDRLEEFLQVDDATLGALFLATKRARYGRGPL